MEQCPRAVWCDQGSQPHTIHQQTLGTWPGVAVTGEPRGMTAQLIVAGDGEPVPVLALVDSLSLRQWDCELAWSQLLELTAQAELAVGRFRPMGG